MASALWGRDFFVDPVYAIYAAQIVIYIEETKKAAMFRDVGGVSRPILANT